MTDKAAAPSCSLDARDFKDRVAWISALNGKFLRDHRRHGSTLALIFVPEALREVEEMIAREKGCCGFLDFRLRTARDRVELTITVPEGQEADADVLLAPFYGNQAGTGRCSRRDGDGNYHSWGETWLIRRIKSQR